MNIWTFLGILFLALGFIGALLPIMPTVPFVLLAAACFAKSSPKMHRWMRQHRKYGPNIRNWERERCLSRKMKIWSILMMTVGGGISTWLFVPRGWMSRVVFGVFLLGDIVVMMLRECPPEKKGGPGEDEKQCS